MAQRDRATHTRRITADTRSDVQLHNVAHFKALGKEVVFDAEHYFDGHHLDAEYALATLAAAGCGVASPSR